MEQAFKATADHPMNTRPWLATYAENAIPAEINADAFPSVVHMLDAAMQRFADRPAFHSFGQHEQQITPY